MTRGGRRKDREDGPERRCIVSGESGSTYGLVRFVVGPDGGIVPDLAEKLPGRGIWLSSDRDSLRTAVKKRAFSRAAPRWRFPRGSKSSSNRCWRAGRSIRWASPGRRGLR